MEKKTIGAFISVLRKANGMTQRELAEQLNVSDKAVSRWERDEAMPDLTLIPVLADIFGVTADELLRGQKATGEAPAPQAEEKSKKQLKYLLEKTKTDYSIRTLISVMLAVLGLIAAAILNLGFLRAVAGFWVGCVFFLAAAVTQTIFKIQMDARLNTGEFDDALLTLCKKDLLRRTLLSYSLILVLFAFTLPLGVLPSVVNAGIDIEHWFPDGLGWAIIAGIVAFPVSLFVWLKKTGKAARAKLLRKTLVILILVCMCTLFLQGALEGVLYNNRHWFGTGTKYDSFEHFLSVIEKPADNMVLLEEQTQEGKPTLRIYRYVSDATFYHDEYFYAINCRFQGDIRTYFHVNREITYIQVESDVIYTYTSDQSVQVHNAISSVIAWTSLLYPLEIAAAVLLYRRKAKALP